MSKKSIQKKKHKRICRIEELENREMLDAGLFAAVKDAYTDLKLGDYADYNIIEVDPAQLSPQTLRTALGQAAQTVQDDIIVVRKEGTHTLDLGSESLKIDIDYAKFGSVTIVALGTGTLQLQSTADTGVIHIANGNAALGGIILAGLGDVSVFDLIQTENGANVQTSQIIKWTEHENRQGNYGLGDTLITNASTTSKGIAPTNATIGTKTFSITFGVGGTLEAYLTGLPQTEKDSIIEGSMDFLNNINPFDAEKNGQADSQLCWAGSAANMLAYTGWGNINNFNNEDDIFNYFRDHFADQGGHQFYANEWFITGDYNAPNSFAQPKTTSTHTGFYTDTNYNTIAGFHNITNSVTVIGSAVDYLMQGYAVGLQLGWYNTQGNRNGGHAITMWGAIYDTALHQTDTGYFVSLLITDSDDNKNQGAGAPNLLKNLNIQYAGTGVTSGGFTFHYNLPGYSNSTGYLEGFTYLAPLATSDEINYNEHEWNLVQSQRLADYAAWTLIDGEYRLTAINADNKGLTGTLDLSDCTELITLDVSSNQLTSLDLTGLTKLITLNVSNNYLPFSALPLPSSLPSGVTIYTYTDQTYILPETTGNNRTADLSEEYEIGNKLTTFTLTTFTWYKANGTPLTSDDYAEDGDGIFIFNPALSGQYVYAAMNNDAFPSLVIHTSMILVGETISAPENLTATATPGAATQNNNAIITVNINNNDNSAVYQVDAFLRSDRQGRPVHSITMPPGQTIAEFTGLWADTTYYFNITKLNNENADAPTTASAKTATVNDDISQNEIDDLLRIDTYAFNGNSIKVYWDTVAGAAHYIIEWTSTTGEPITGSIIVQATSTVLVNMRVGTTFNITVTAVGKPGFANIASTPVSVTTEEESLADEDALVVKITPQVANGGNDTRIRPANKGNAATVDSVTITWAVMRNASANITNIENNAYYEIFARETWNPANGFTLNGVRYWYTTDGNVKNTSNLNLNNSNNKTTSGALHEAGLALLQRGVAIQGYDITLNYTDGNNYNGLTLNQARAVLHALLNEHLANPDNLVWHSTANVFNDIGWISGVTIKGLSAGMTYQLTIRAFNYAGETRTSISNAGKANERTNYLADAHITARTTTIAQTNVRGLAVERTAATIDSTTIRWNTPNTGVDGYIIEIRGRATYVHPNTLRTVNVNNMVLATITININEHGVPVVMNVEVNDNITHSITINRVSTPVAVLNPLLAHYGWSFGGSEEYNNKAKVLATAALNGTSTWLADINKISRTYLCVEGLLAGMTYTYQIHTTYQGERFVAQPTRVETHARYSASLRVDASFRINAATLRYTAPTASVVAKDGVARSAIAITTPRPPLVPTTGTGNNRIENTNHANYGFISETNASFWNIYSDFVIEVYAAGTSAANQVAADNLLLTTPDAVSLVNSKEGTVDRIAGTLPGENVIDKNTAQRTLLELRLEQGKGYIVVIRAVSLDGQRSEVRRVSVGANHNMWSPT